MKVQITITVISLILIGIGVYSTWEHIVVADFLTQIVAGAILSIPIIAIWGFKPLIERIRNTGNNTKLEKHQKEISEAVKIISEGYYGEDDFKNTKFLIPYPYDEYKKEERKEKYPTNEEKTISIDEMFNPNSNPYQTEIKKYEFVPFDKSNEAKFNWAWEHLQFYNDIQDKIKALEKIYLENDKFNKTNNEKIIEIVNAMYRGKKIETSLSDQWHKNAKKLFNAQQEMQEELNILFHKLDRNEPMKGKCKFCR